MASADPVPGIQRSNPEPQAGRASPAVPPLAPGNGRLDRVPDCLPKLRQAPSFRPSFAGLIRALRRCPCRRCSC